MDDFEYSVQISELDWDLFFQTCEECNMLPPGLAGVDDSGMSDMDDMANQRTQTATPSKPTDLVTDQIDGPPDCEGSPVDLYLRKYGLKSPDQVLSGSEDDVHLEAVNVFFERLKSVSLTGDQASLKSKLAEGYDLKEDNKSIAAAQSNRNQTAKRNDCPTYSYTESTDDEFNREIYKSTCSDTEMFIQKENWSLDVLKEGDKWEAKLRTQPETEKSQYSRNVLVNGEKPTNRNQVEQANSELVASSNSDLVLVQPQASKVTPRRRRRKKKRMSAELMENDPGYEVQLPRRVRDSDEDLLYGRRRREIDQETHMAECCGSETVSVVCHAPHDVVEHHKKNSISKNFLGVSELSSVMGGSGTSTLTTTNFQEELNQRAVSIAQRKKEREIMPDSNRTGKSTANREFGMRTDLKSPEPGTSVTETPQSDDYLFGDDAGNHSQLNRHFPSQIQVPFDVTKIERNPTSKEHLVKLSVSHHADDAKSQTHSTSFQVAPVITTQDVVYAKPPKHHVEDKVTLSTFPFDGSGAVGQRKTSISSVTFPELTDSTLVSASFGEEQENSSSVTHIEVPFEQKSKNLKAEGCASGMSDLQLLTKVNHVNTAHINHQNGHMVQINSSHISEREEIMEAQSVEPKACISSTSKSSPNEDHKEENCPSLKLKHLLESMNSKAVEILNPDFKGDRHEYLQKEQIKKYQPLACITNPDSQLSDDSKSEHTLCDTLTNSEKQKGQVHYVDEPPCFPSKVHNISPPMVVHSPSPPPESTDGSKSLQIKDADLVSQPTPPIYAMSLFWNEMEKLTINDILRLRLVGQAQHSSMLLHPEDNIITDVTDAADSGYLTHVDEAKPDKSIGEISFISDFDGDPVPLLSPDAGELEEETPNPKCVTWESSPHVTGTVTEMEDMFHSDATQSSPLHKSHSSHFIRKLCKNVSVQNLQELENKNFQKTLRNTSLHPINSAYSTVSEVQADYVDPFDRVETSSPVYLSEEEDVDSTSITFSEIFEYLFGANEPTQFVSEADIVAASYPRGTETSVPEMYDHFFSEFEPENLFYPLANDNSTTNDELVPIFSSSRSATRNVQFPEAYDYFFPDDSPVHSDEDEDPEQTVIRVVTRYDYMPTQNHDSAPSSDPCKDFFPEKTNNWNFTWTNPFSFRRIRRTGFTIAPEKFGSQALTPVKHACSPFRRGIQPINILGVGENPFPDSVLLSLDNRIFKQLAEQQKLCKEMQTVVVDPRLDAPLLPIKQADMCLVCIALASWVLKSVNSQGSDTWKAVLLANISALSAIRYLRRFTRDEAAKIPALRQIEPA